MLGSLNAILGNVGWCWEILDRAWHSYQTLCNIWWSHGTGDQQHNDNRKKTTLAPSVRDFKTIIGRCRFIGWSFGMIGLKIISLRNAQNAVMANIFSVRSCLTKAWVGLTYWELYIELWLNLLLLVGDLLRDWPDCLYMSQRDESYNYFPDYKRSFEWSLNGILNELYGELCDSVPARDL
jgi:hypothetical protein